MVLECTRAVLPGNHRLIGKETVSRQTRYRLHARARLCQQGALRFGSTGRRRPDDETGAVRARAIEGGISRSLSGRTIIHQRKAVAATRGGLSS